MRNVFNELPIFLLCVCGGIVIGAVGFIFRLPRLLFDKKRGKRANFGLKLLFVLFDLLTCSAGLAIAAITLLRANGVELRFYALAAIALGCILTYSNLKKLFL